MRTKRALKREQRPCQCPIWCRPRKYGNAISARKFLQVVSHGLDHSSGNEQQKDETALWGEYFQQFLGKDENAIEAMSDLSFPIVGDISRVDTFSNDNRSDGNHSVLGIVVATIYWRSMLRYEHLLTLNCFETQLPTDRLLTVYRNVLPKDSNGIHIVFENACSPSFTYEINGATERYLGVNDHHEQKYHHMHMERKLYDLSTLSNQTTRYRGAPLDEDYCPFTLHLYPSEKMASAYITNNPTIFALTTAMIFLFTALVFYLYDVTVEIRQKSVMQTAVHSSAIVSSLFPSSVRDQLFSVSQGPAPTEDRLHRRSPSSDENESNFSGSAIAQAYPETTVLFADIAGFTAWSSSRQPTQVFQLLETIYAAFDKLAKQHGVFKVETIGDCYVAVVGLPTPRKSHAVVMARFASDCRNKMQELAMQLEEQLGEVREMMDVYGCTINSEMN
jgi:Adenylate and Guanylate cyclase catalytic domain